MSTHQFRSSGFSNERLRIIGDESPGIHLRDHAENFRDRNRRRKLETTSGSASSSRILLRHKRDVAGLENLSLVHPCLSSARRWSVRIELKESILERPGRRSPYSRLSTVPGVAKGSNLRKYIQSAKRLYNSRFRRN